MQRNIYFDSNASHPLLPAVKKEMAGLLLSSEDLVNPSSIHRPGQKAKRVLTELREELCSYLGRSDTDEFVFLSGATEALNLSMRSFVHEKLKAGRKPVLIISTVDHSAVLDTSRDLAENFQVEVITLPVDSFGQIDEIGIKTCIQNLLSQSELTDVLWMAQATNNETGVSFQFRTILPELLKEFAPKILLDKPRIKQKYQKSPQRLWIAIDAAQALGKLSESDMRFMLHFADYAAFSAHKLGGPMGIGALWHRPEAPLKIQMTGGVQERKRRAGTHNILGLFGFLIALKEWKVHGETWRAQMFALRQRAISEMIKIPGLTLHGCKNSQELPALCNTINFHVDGCVEESLLLSLDLSGFALSSGSACNSGSLKPSHVLKAMGYTTDQALSSIRLCLGVQSTEAEVDDFVTVLKEKIEHIRKSRVQSKEFLEELDGKTLTTNPLGTEAAVQR